MSARADIGAIGFRIRERRMAMGLTQDALAKKLDVTAQAVSKWETGMGCPDIYVLPDIAHVLEISVDELLGIQSVKLDAETGAVSKPVDTAGAPDTEDTQTPEPLAFFEEDTDRAFEEAEKWVKANEPKLETQADPTGTWPQDFSPAAETETLEEPHTASDQERSVFGAESDQKKEEQDTGYAQKSDSGLYVTEDVCAETGEAVDSGDDFDLDAEMDNVAEQINRKISAVFDGSNFGMDLSRFINSQVRSAMASAKTVRANGSSDRRVRTCSYGDEALLRGLDLDVAGSGEILVHTGPSGVWDAKITAPEYMFPQIVCQAKNGILCLKIPAASQFGFHAGSSKVRVEIHTGFSLGESLRLNVRGSTDTKIEPDFENSDVHISGSGDVAMADAGTFTYAVAGSGDLVFGDARDASIRVSGSGDVHGGCLTGRTDVHISGSGDFSADAISGTLEAVTSGSGDFSINEGLIDSLKIRISGSGDFYGPNLEIGDAEIRITGGGEVVLARVKGKLIQNISKSARVRIRQHG